MIIWCHFDVDRRVRSCVRVRVRLCGLLSWSLLGGGRFASRLHGFILLVPHVPRMRVVSLAWLVLACHDLSWLAMTGLTLHGKAASSECCFANRLDTL